MRPILCRPAATVINPRLSAVCQWTSDRWPLDKSGWSHIVAREAPEQRGSFAKQLSGFHQQMTTTIWWDTFWLEHSTNQTHSWGGLYPDHKWLCLNRTHSTTVLLQVQNSHFFRGHLSESWWSIWCSFLFQVWSLPQKSGSSKDNKCDGRNDSSAVQTSDISLFPSFRQSREGRAGGQLWLRFRRQL